MAAFGRFRLALLAAATVAVAGLGIQTTLEAVQSRAQVEADAARQTQNLARTLEMQTRGGFREIELAVTTIAEALTPRPGAPAIGGEAVRAMIAARLSDAGVLRNIVVTDAHGDVRYDGIRETAPVNIADREHFTIHRDRADAGTVISQPVLGRVGRGWYVALSRRIADERGNFAGVVFAALDLSHLDRSFASLDVGPHGIVTLWNRDGVVLARQPREEAVAADPAHFAARIRNTLPDGQREITRHGASPMDGTTRVVTVRAVEGLPLVVSVLLAEADYLAPWWAAVRRDAVTLGLVVAVVAVLTALLLRYLRRLEDMTRALQASERRARATFDSTYQYMGILAPDGTVLALNRAAMDVTDGEREGDIGRPAWERRTWAAIPESAERLRAAVREAAAGGSVRFEAEVQAIGGGRRTVDFSIKPVHDERGRVVLLVPEAHDITERYRMEISLRESEARLRSYLDAAMEGIFVADAEGRYVDANPAACRMLGYTRDELLAMRVADLVAADHPLTEASLASFATLLRAGVFRGEVVMRQKDGGIRLAELNAVKIDGGRYLGVTRDVTERRRAEEALRSSRARLAALLQALPDLAFLLDGQGRYQEV
ncbi:MAG TPA: PAS domain S-box protein, partial [Azospirillum sp.]